MKKYLKRLLVTFVCCLGYVSHGQENFVSENARSWEKEVDSLFSNLGGMEKPGAIIAIIDNNELAYLKSFGAADIGNRTPITKNTRFHIGSMARHFTAFAILLLADQDKLSFQAEVRNYLPQLPPFKKPVKIIDLLQQADGFYDYNNINQLLGRPDDGKLSNEAILRLMEKQIAPNFSPGTDFVDTTTDTSMLLLAEIIGKVSGKPFATFMKEEIFDPIGMAHTVVVPSQYGQLDHLARPYLNRNGAFVSGDTYDRVYGVSNMFATIEDLIKWEMHMLDPTVGNPRLFKKLNSVVTLENGKPFHAIQGRLTLGQQYHHFERDLFATYHTGAYGGYASSMFKFPDQGYIAIVLSNNGEGYNGYYGVLASHIVLKDHYKEPATIDINSLSIQPISKEKLVKPTGDYWDHRGGLYRTIVLKNDTLQYVRNNGRATPLYHLGNNRFQMLTGYDDKIFLTFEGNGNKMKMWYQGGEGSPILFENFKFQPEKDEWYRNYTGTYYCDLLQVGYQLIYEEGALVLRNVYTSDITLKRIREELFNGNQWFMRTLVFNKNPQGRIIGFHTAMAELNGLHFRKID